MGSDITTDVVNELGIPDDITIGVVNTARALRRSEIRLPRKQLPIAAMSGLDFYAIASYNSRSLYFYVFLA